VVPRRFCVGRKTPVRIRPTKDQSSATRKSWKKRPIRATFRGTLALASFQMEGRSQTGLQDHNYPGHIVNFQPSPAPRKRVTDYLKCAGRCHPSLPAINCNCRRKEHRVEEKLQRKKESARKHGQRKGRGTGVARNATSPWLREEEKKKENRTSAPQRKNRHWTVRNPNKETRKEFHNSANIQIPGGSPHAKTGRGGGRLPRVQIS